MFYIIAVTGFPFFYANQEFIVIGLLISLFIFWKNRHKFNSNFFIVSLLFFFIELLQMLLITELNVRTLLGTQLRLFYAFTTLAIIGKDYLGYFIKTIYFFTLISFIFYFLSFYSGFYYFMVEKICPYFTTPFYRDESFYKYAPNIILFSFEKSLYQYNRNPGPFWEPGAFAIFLNLALLFNLIKTRKLIEKRNIVFISGIITTFSTTGFITLFITLSGFYIFTSGHKLKYIYVFVILILGISTYKAAEFMEEKIIENYISYKETSSSRFGSAYLDLLDFSTSPILGWGRGEYRYGGIKFSLFTQEQHRNNGLTSLLVSYGLLIFILYLFLISKGFYHYLENNHFNKNYLIFMLICFLVMAFSQGILMLSFFYSLMLYSTIHTNSHSQLFNKTI